jgi:hypothetical protein
MNISDRAISSIRTITPIIAGYILATIFTSLVGIGSKAVASAVFAILYYEIARTGESNGKRAFSFMLGFPKQPIYQLDTEVLASATSGGVFDYEEEEV